MFPTLNLILPGFFFYKPFLLILIFKSVNINKQWKYDNNQCKISLKFQENWPGHFLKNISPKSCYFLWFCNVLKFGIKFAEVVTKVFLRGLEVHDLCRVWEKPAGRKIRQNPRQSRLTAGKSRQNQESVQPAHGTLHEAYSQELCCWQAYSRGTPAYTL